MKSLNKFNTLFVMLMLLVAFGPARTLLAGDEVKTVKVQSKLAFDDTVTSIRKMTAKNGMMVLSEINQGKILSMTGLKIKSLSLFIGNPTVGKKLFSQNIGVGIAVPIRVSIYESKDGKTYIDYIKPSDQLASFHNEKIGMIAGMLDKKLQGLTSALAK